MRDILSLANMALFPARAAMCQPDLSKGNLPVTYEEAVEELVKARLLLQAQAPFIHLASITSGIINQINNLLSRPTMQCSLILEAPDLPEEVKRRIGCMKGDLAVLAQLVRLINADFHGGPEDNTRRSANEMVNLADLLEYVRALAAHRAEFKQHMVDIAVDASPARIVLPSPLLRIALINLAFNGVDATPVGSVTLKGDILPDYVEIHVTDTGHGMSPEILTQCRESFFTTRLSEGGCGLGLWTADQIIQSVNGTLEIHSEQGSGTCCLIRLPLIT
ncbi:MAG TPA: HAMP domain-containing sensor histidine kinase [Patescibacteria group bacterium]